MEKFDLIVVGAGLAGLTAAYTAAKEGLQVVLAERGTHPGTKTVSGGLLYAHALERLFPRFWEENPSPVERAIDRNVLTFLTKSSAVSLDFFDPAFSRPPFNAFSVLRSRLDPWLAAKAEGAGAVPAYGVKIDSLVRENGTVVGIRAGDDEIRARVVVLAEGANTVLSREAGLLDETVAEATGIGVKQVIGLPSGEVERRFQLQGSSGSQYTTVGFPARVAGGGFLYTNRDSLSIGLIVNMRSLVAENASMVDILEEFKMHPFLARLLDGGTLLEYSGCFVGEGGYAALPPLSGAGYVVAGSAAGFFLNTGFTLRGMDFAIESGRLAGETAVRAVRANNASASVLSGYRDALAHSFVLRELRTHRGYPAVFGNPRLYELYPELVGSMLHRLFRVDGSGRPNLRRLFAEARRGQVSLVTLARDLWKAARTL